MSEQAEHARFVASSGDELCPKCGCSLSLRSKLILIDQAWVAAPDEDTRAAYFSSLRADDVQPDKLRPEPLEQFMDGFYCERCHKGFVSEQGLKESRRKYWL